MKTVVTTKREENRREKRAKRQVGREDVATLSTPL